MTKVMMLQYGATSMFTGLVNLFTMGCRKYQVKLHDIKLLDCVVVEYSSSYSNCCVILRMHLPRMQPLCYYKSIEASRQASHYRLMEFQVTTTEWSMAHVLTSFHAICQLILGQFTDTGLTTLQVMFYDSVVSLGTHISVGT